MLLLDRLDGVELDGVDELDVPLTDEVNPRDEELDRLDEEDRLLSELDDSELLDDRELDLELLFVLEDLLDELSVELLELDRLDCEYGLLDVLELLDLETELTVFEELVLENSAMDESEVALVIEEVLDRLLLDWLLLLEDVDELFERLVSELDDSDDRLDVELTD